jgi:trans-aconitate methyltransferase
VPALGASILDRLAAQAGERILDVGCGDGSLTFKLAERGAIVVGVDASPDMVRAAHARGLDVRMMDAAALTFDREFDAVFSNAALHWIHQADAVLAGVHRALKPAGRLVAEFGGHGCVAAIHTALRAVLSQRSVDAPSPWYFPTGEEYRALVEAAGFVVDDIRLFSRPTPLPTGIDGWLETFGRPLLDLLPAADRPPAMREIEALLQPVLCDRSGHWTADYVRLQVVAHV